MSSSPQQFVFDVEQRHAPAIGEKPLRYGEPNAACGAGHQRDFLRGGRHAAVLVPLFRDLHTRKDNELAAFVNPPAHTTSCNCNRFKAL